MNLSLVYRQKISMTSIGRWPNIKQAVAAATKYYESTCANTETNDDQKQEDILSLSNSTLNVVTSNEEMVSSPILNLNHKHKKKRKAFLDDSEEEEDSEDNNENPNCYKQQQQQQHKPGNTIFNGFNVESYCCQQHHQETQYIFG